MKITQILNASVLILLIFSFESFSKAYSAYDHTFTFTGEDEVGSSINGIINFYNNDYNFNGKIIDENGLIHEFRGHWVNPARIWSYD